jgi:hypothetical protein
VIPHDALINALRSLNYTFKRQADRVEIYKRRGAATRVAVRRNALHDDDYARAILKQAGMPHDQIEPFIAATSRPKNLH